jgi:enoyl-CoA hydratase/carnithine racemase
VLTLFPCARWKVRAYYQYDHDPSLRAAIPFGYGKNFSRGIDVEGFKSLARTGKPWIEHWDDRPSCKTCSGPSGMNGMIVELVIAAIREIASLPSGRACYAG